MKHRSRHLSNRSGQVLLIAIGLCLGCLLWLLAATAREIYGRPFRWPAALLFLGCVGLWDRAHQLSPDIGLLVAYALGSWCDRREPGALRRRAAVHVELTRTLRDVVAAQ